MAWLAWPLNSSSKRLTVSTPLGLGSAVAEHGGERPAVEGGTGPHDPAVADLVPLGHQRDAGGGLGGVHLVEDGGVAAVTDDRFDVQAGDDLHQAREGGDVGVGIRVGLEEPDEGHVVGQQLPGRRHVAFLHGVVERGDYGSGVTQRSLLVIDRPPTHRPIFNESIEYHPDGIVKAPVEYSSPQPGGRLQPVDDRSDRLSASCSAISCQPSRWLTRVPAGRSS